MIFNVTGGGAALNFKLVVSSAQPENPGENTIWVNSASEGTGWALSADAPADPAEGMVWLTVDSSAPVSLNVSKKQVLMTYLMMCHQYVNGEWVSRDAQIYQAGQWQPVGCFVVQNGVKMVDLQEKGSGHTIDWDQDGWCYIQCVKSGTDPTSYVYCYTSEAIDMTDFSSIVLSYRALGGNSMTSMSMFMGVCAASKTPAANCNGLTNADAKVSATPAALGVDWDLTPYKEQGNTGSLVLDVSSLSGEYRIIWGLANNSTGSSTINRYTKSYIGSIDLRG